MGDAKEEYRGKRRNTIFIPYGSGVPVHMSTIANKLSYGAPRAVNVLLEEEVRQTRTDQCAYLIVNYNIPSLAWPDYNIVSRAKMLVGGIGIRAGMVLDLGA